MNMVKVFIAFIDLVMDRCKSLMFLYYTNFGFLMISGGIEFD